MITALSGDYDIITNMKKLGMHILVGAVLSVEKLFTLFQFFSTLVEFESTTDLKPYYLI